MSPGPESHLGVEIGAANDAFMPISPIVILELRPEQGLVEVPDELVLEYCTPLLLH